MLPGPGQRARCPAGWGSCSGGGVLPGEPGARTAGRGPPLAGWRGGGYALAFRFSALGFSFGRREGCPVSLRLLLWRLGWRGPRNEAVLAEAWRGQRCVCGPGLACGGLTLRDFPPQIGLLVCTNFLHDLGMNLVRNTFERCHLYVDTFCPNKCVLCLGLAKAPLSLLDSDFSFLFRKVTFTRV